MNILHHKSWHVRNKNNIAKVRAAEKALKDEEEAKEKRKLVAESEARVNLLRSKARLAGSTRGDDATVSSIAAILDGKEPSSVGEDRQNEDHAREAKKDKEEWEKKVGILTYLGQGCEEDKPWYLLDHNSRMNFKEEEPPVAGSTVKPKTYLKNDPLIEMERNLALMKKSKAKETSSIPLTNAYPLPSVIKPSVKEESERSLRTKKEKKCKHKKHKKHKSRHKKSAKKSRSSNRSESDSSDSDESSSSDDEDDGEKRAKLEALRAERLRREKAERERANQLLNKSLKPEPKVELDERKRGYNSQFNPHLARQNCERNQAIP